MRDVFARALGNILLICKEKAMNVMYLPSSLLAGYSTCVQMAREAGVCAIELLSCILQIKHIGR
jgi:hypothetical protein